MQVPQNLKLTNPRDAAIREKIRLIPTSSHLMNFSPLCKASGTSMGLRDTAFVEPNVGPGFPAAGTDMIIPDQNINKSTYPHIIDTYSYLNVNGTLLSIALVIPRCQSIVELLRGYR